MPFVGFQATHRGTRLCCSAERSGIEDVKDFWNSDYLDRIKKKMLRGETVSACRSCYKTEAEGKISLRNHYNSVYKDIAIEDTPTALDLDFSNLCNLQCIMCGPDRSSQWTKELGRKKLTPISKSQLDQLCVMSHNVKHLTIQGGEPSIMPEFVYYFEYLKKKNLMQNIDLDCISNLTNVNNKFYELIDNFKSVNINASVDSYGLANDYIRYPSNFKKIEQNLVFLASTRIQVNLQITLQTLSMFNFFDFLLWVNKMQAKYREQGRTLGLSLSYVSNPRYLDIQHAPKKLKQKMMYDIEKFYSSKVKLDQSLKFNIEIRNIRKTLLKNNEKKYVDELRNYLVLLDSRRNIKITNFIPDFHKYV